MSARSFADRDPQGRSIRKPSYQMQEAALAAGYGSVRDWAIDQLIDEVKILKARVAALEGPEAEEVVT